MSRDVIFLHSHFMLCLTLNQFLDPFPHLVLPVSNLDASPSSPTHNILPLHQPSVPAAPPLELAVQPNSLPNPIPGPIPEQPDTPKIHHDISTSDLAILADYAPLTKKSIRNSRPFSYLNDFYCTLTTSCPYPLLDYLCYKTFSPSYSTM